MSSVTPGLYNSKNIQKKKVTFFSSKYNGGKNGQNRIKMAFKIFLIKFAL